MFRVSDLKSIRAISTVKCNGSLVEVHYNFSHSNWPLQRFFFFQCFYVKYSYGQNYSVIYKKTIRAFLMLPSLFWNSSQDMVLLGWFRFTKLPALPILHASSSIVALDTSGTGIVVTLKNRSFIFSIGTYTAIRCDTSSDKIGCIY